MDVMFLVLQIIHSDYVMFYMGGHYNAPGTLLTKPSLTLNLAGPNLVRSVNIELLKTAAPGYDDISPKVL